MRAIYIDLKNIFIKCLLSVANEPVKYIDFAKTMKWHWNISKYYWSIYKFSQANNLDL